MAFFRTKLLTALLAGCIAWVAVADDVGENEPDRPLFEKMPFNRITLVAQYDGKTYDVLPITFADGQRHNVNPQTGELVVRFVNSPLKELKIFWTAIAKIELFSELVEQEFLQRLETLSQDVRELSPENERWPGLAVRFEQMFDYLRYLGQHRDELPNYMQGYRKFLFEEGLYRIRSNDYRSGAARFELLYGKEGEHKEYPGLETAWSKAFDREMEEETLSGNEAKCRRHLERFKEFYPDNPVVQAWEGRLRTATLKLCDQSKKAFDGKEYLAAHRCCEDAVRITPDLPELLQWRQRLFSEAPRIDIGVCSPLNETLGTVSADLPDWGTRRGRRILCRMLCEFRHPSLEGGVYVSPLGDVERGDRNSTIRWTFPADRRSARQFGVYDVADTILGFSAGSKDSQTGLAASAPLENMVDSLEIVSTDRLDIRLAHGCLVPEALFVLPILETRRFSLPGRETEIPVRDGLFERTGEQSIGSLYRDGLFLWKSREDRRAGFELNALSVAAPGPENSSAPPKVVFEHTVLRGEEALELLLAGKIDMIDRIVPWELDNLKKNKDFVTGRYRLPTVHFLLPNMKNPLLRSRTFRRALLYGLNREAMLAKLTGKDGEGTVLSAPFLRGRSLDDPLGYGYDNSIRPRPYEPKLAIALSLLAFDQVRNREPGWEKIEAVPELVLACPNHETARYVSLMIRRQWEAIGVPVKIVEYREDEPVGLDGEIDFWLVDRIVEEPLLDARRIFGTRGMLRSPSPYMELALEKLHVAEDWPTAGKCLQGIHRLCFEETTVLPLWQLTEHYVHRAGIGGVGDENGIFDLYQNVLRWTVLP